MRLIIYVICIVFFSSICFAQNNKQNSFNKAKTTSKYYNEKRYTALSTSKNTYNFMALGYYINANNNMYLKTKDKSFLEANLDIIKPILIDESSSNYLNDNWKMNVEKSNQNSSSNGKDHSISEAYFFRYVGEYLDILKSNNIYKEYHSKIFKGIKSSFYKWKNKSFKQYGDYSLLFHQRIHIGANWAIVALYLNKFDGKNNSDYKDFYTLFDKQLQKTLVLKQSGGLNYYVWNMNYPEKFTKFLQSIKKDNLIIQDVSHGNHVVLYLIKAKELNNKTWTNFNFQYLSNTLKLKILVANSIKDNVDGSSTPSLKNTGWKISDGWLKLIYKDNSLEPLFEKSLKNYQSNIKNSSLELQFKSIYL